MKKLLSASIGMYVLGLFVVSCAKQTVVKRLDQSNLATINKKRESWIVKNVEIQFVAGPSRDSGDRYSTFSYYKFTFPDEQSKNVNSYVLESGIGDYDTAQSYGESIDIFSSKSSNTFLIVEDIPNDSGPCYNYILVSLKQDNASEHNYLDMSVYNDLVEKDHNRGSYGARVLDSLFAQPQILSINDEGVSLKTTGGKKMKVKWKDISKLNGPMQPG